VAQARHHLDQYAALLWTELGIRPSATLTDRITAAGGGLRTHPARTPEPAGHPTERAHRSLQASIPIME